MTTTIQSARRLSARGIALASTAAVLSLGMLAPVAAQSTAPAPQATQTEFSDAKLDAFVASLQEVDQIRQSYVPQIEAAENETAQAELVESANAEIVESIESNPDLSVEEYIMIVQVAQQDPELNERIVARVQTEME